MASVEVAVDSVVSALAAERGGASRVELCDSLADGGTTPSAGMISAVKATVRIPVFVIIRPRGGNFVYTREELGVMRLDIEAARMLGADGVVVGSLTHENRVDEGQLATMMGAAGDLSVSFHRAFDLTADKGEALESLIRAGVSRVLTSGGAASAIDGVTTIRDLVKRAGERIVVMAGGGVREETVQEIVNRTGVAEVHVRGASTITPRGSGGPTRVVKFRKALPENEDAWDQTDEKRIRDFVRLANLK